MLKNSAVDDCKVSLLVPLYKTPKFFVERIINNALNTDIPLMFIFVNDSGCELDYVTKVISRLENTHHGYLYKDNSQNKGITATYCEALKECNTEYFGILDHDDEFEFNHELKNVVNSGNYDVIFTNEVKFTSNGHIDPFIKPKFDVLSSLFYFYPHHLTLYKTKNVQKLRLDKALEYKTCFDIWLWANYLNVLNYNLNVKQVNSVAYGWRIHENSTASNINQKAETAEERVKIADSIFQELESNYEVVINEKVPYAISFLYKSKEHLYTVVDGVLKRYEVLLNNGLERKVLGKKEVSRYLTNLGVPIEFVMGALGNVESFKLGIESDSHPEEVPFFVYDDESQFLEFNKVK